MKKSDRMIHLEYIRELVSRISTTLGENLIALYAIGSVTFEDFHDQKSDLDILGITKHPFSKSEKDQLAELLDHSNFPCPAQGLDIVLLTKTNVEEKKPEPSYEFWYSSGENWPKESWEEGKSSEMILLIELCRQKGVKLFGKDSDLEFRETDKKQILEVFKQMLAWHKKHILDDYHDPLGQNSVLNACRILKYIETGNFYSKTAGGRLILKEEPDNLSVQKALKIRLHEEFYEIMHQEIAALIAKVESALEQAIS